MPHEQVSAHTHTVICASSPHILPLQSEEFYVCIYAGRVGNTVLFHHEGGVDIGDVDAKVSVH